MGESFWTHVTLAGSTLIPLILFWLDNRRRTDRFHKENTEKLVRIETKVEPIWSWWNASRQDRNR